MSRIISQKAASAFYAGRAFRLQNTEVRVYDNGVTELYLHGNKIAQRAPGSVHGVRFTLAGWNTVTTRERLNALGIHVYTRKGTPYYDGVAISEYGMYATGTEE